MLTRITNITFLNTGSSLQKPLQVHDMSPQDMMLPGLAIMTALVRLSENPSKMLPKSRNACSKLPRVAEKKC